MRRSAVPSVALLVAAALVGLLLYGVLSHGASRTLDAAVDAGRPPVAPSRPLPVLGGRGRGSLAEYRGRPVLLNFWASWCTTCTAEAPLLRQAQRTLAAHGGTVLGVTYQDAASASLSFARSHGLRYPNLRDVGGTLAGLYGTQGLPETFAVDRQGRIVAISRGELDQRRLDQALQRLGV